VVKRDALIGINAVVNDNAVVGEQAIVAACAFVKAEFVVPPRTLVAGIPAKVLRELSAGEIAWKREATRGYQELAVRSLASLRETTALSEVEPQRRRIAKVAGSVPLSDLKVKSK
jgi:phenylacetic acid degradation protein